MAKAVSAFPGLCALVFITRLRIFLQSQKKSSACPCPFLLSPSCRVLAWGHPGPLSSRALCLQMQKVPGSGVDPLGARCPPPEQCLCHGRTKAALRLCKAPT